MSVVFPVENLRNGSAKRKHTREQSDPLPMSLVDREPGRINDK